MKAVAKLKDEARKNEQLEQWEQAIAAYVEVLRLTNNAESELPLYNRIGDLYVRMGRPGDAVTYYENAADHYAEAGLYNNAIALCNKAMRYVPNRLELLRKLGQFSAAQGFLTDARRWYLEYAERQLKQGAVDDAFTALEDFATLYEDAEIREILGRHLRAHNRPGPALVALKRAYTLRVQAGEKAAADALKAEILAFTPNAFSGEPEVVAAPPAPARPSPAGPRPSVALPGYGDEEVEKAPADPYAAAPAPEPAAPDPLPAPSYVDSRGLRAEPEPPQVGVDEQLAEIGVEPTGASPMHADADDERPGPEAQLDDIERFEDEVGDDLPLLDDDTDDLPLMDVGEPLPESTGNPFALDFPPLGEALSVESGAMPFLSLDDLPAGDPSRDPFSLIDFDPPDLRPGLTDLPAFETPKPLEPIDLSAAFAAMPPPTAPPPPAKPPTIVPAPPPPPSTPPPAPPVLTPVPEEPVMKAPPVRPTPPARPIDPNARPADEWGDPPEWVTKTPASPMQQREEPAPPDGSTPSFPPESDPDESDLPAREPYFPPESAWGEPIGFEPEDEDDEDEAGARAAFTRDPDIEAFDEIESFEPPVFEPEVEPEPEADPEPEPLPELPPPSVFRGSPPSASPAYQAPAPRVPMPPPAHAPEPPPRAAEPPRPPEPMRPPEPTRPPEPPPRAPAPPARAPEPPAPVEVAQATPPQRVETRKPVVPPPAPQVEPRPELVPAAARASAAKPERPAAPAAARTAAAEFASIQQQIHAGDSAGALSRLDTLHGELAAQGKFRDAWHACELLLQLEPSNLKALQQRVEYASSLGQRDLLLRSYLELARHLMESGAENKGAVIYQRVLDIDPFNEEAQAAVHSAQVPSTTGGYVDLFSLISEEENEASTRFMVEEKPPTGDEERDFADMLSQFKQKVAAHLSIDDSTAHYDLGLAFKEMGLIDEAIAEFQTAMKGGGERLKVYEELGQCFLLKQQYNVAVNVLNRALQMPVQEEGDRVGVYYALGRSYEELGQNAHARAAYEHVVGLDINFQDASQRLAKL